MYLLFIRLRHGSWYFYILFDKYYDIRQFWDIIISINYLLTYLQNTPDRVCTSKQQIGLSVWLWWGVTFALEHRKPWLYCLRFQPLPWKDRRSDCRKPVQETGPLTTQYKSLLNPRTPRRILLMGRLILAPTAPSILKPYLDKGDIIIDGGNTFQTPSVVTVSCLPKVLTLSVPVFLVVKRAFERPSIMPGGQKESLWKLVVPILKAIAAVAEDGEPCVTYIGADGAGHYVKMVHNGIGVWRHAVNCWSLCAVERRSGSFKRRAGAKPSPNGTKVNWAVTR